MADPLTALMYAVQVMNFLKTLIVKTLREREDVIVDAGPVSRFDHFDENNGPHCSFRGTIDDETNDESNKEDQDFPVKEPTLESQENTSQVDLTSKSQSQGQSQTTMVEEEGVARVAEGGARMVEVRKSRCPQSSNSKHKKVLRKNVEKSKESTIVSRLNSRTERIEAWR